MTITVAINGFGRIGRNVLRAVYESGRTEQIRVVAINELAEPEGIAHLLKYDTTHGPFAAEVNSADNAIIVNGSVISLCHEEQISDLNWHSKDIDIVLDCTGEHGSRADAEAYFRQGVGKVIYSHPADADVDATIVFGVNHDTLRASDRIISNASCTTNCIIPVIEVLDHYFGVESGTITTIHSAMHDQQVIDAYHPDLRRARAAGHSIIPVDTKLAKGIERILPRFAGRFEAIAVRVPTLNVTAMDLSVTVRDPVDIQRVNLALKAAASDELKGILSYTELPLVSSDFNHDPHSCIVDSSQTRVSHKHLVKLLVWCDNEWGFANRMLDTTIAAFNAKD